MLDEETRNQVKYWILEISHYFPNMCKFSVVGTKDDLCKTKVELPAFPKMPTFFHSQVLNTFNSC